MIPDTSAGRGSTHLLKSRPKRLSWLRTGLQEVNGTSRMNGGFVQSWAHLGHNKVSALGDALLQINSSLTVSSLLYPTY